MIYAVNGKRRLRLVRLAILPSSTGSTNSDFADFIELEKAQGVKYIYTMNYCNYKQCGLNLSNTLVKVYENEVKNKLERCNFLTVLCDGSTDASIVEKECIYHCRPLHL